MNLAPAPPPSYPPWVQKTLVWAFETLFRAAIVFGLLALTATKLSDLSEVKSAILVGAVFGAEKLAERLRPDP